ncbi:hypothetical protein DFJ67_5716 [Asanoa ferruginea]|uniref:Uncharacterized protein n=1 Tax=Asanoa ferruginea TaxID=53367 RepID=A0A3D9ZQN9_9ACTN|nr:hypothetical protein [Asanoa ferruginea]REF99676.1 hypothetical protein DFJ67_5716 [Asanoa ferruginea]GIF52067.1 hypothetical protein Afe04nite_66060 [Asanoa ferruginea]
MRWTRRILVAAGTGVMAYALFGALTDPATEPAGQLAFLAAVVIAHDAILMPLIIGLGFLIGRFAPIPVRRPIRVAAIISLAVTLIAIPFVLGRGRRPDDPSALPLDYGRGLLIILALVWAVALVATLTRRRQPR